MSSCLTGLVTLNDMKAKQEALVKEREKQLAKKEQSKELQLWVPHPQQLCKEPPSSAPSAQVSFSSKPCLTVASLAGWLACVVGAISTNPCIPTHLSHISVKKQYDQ